MSIKSNKTKGGLVLTHGRRDGQRCRACKLIICNCSNGCKCSEEKIARVYEAEGFSIEDTDDGLTLDVILSSISGMEKRGPLLRTELEWLPVHVPHENGVYNEEQLKGIQAYLDAFVIKLKCEDCIEHYKTRPPFEGNTPLDLWKYINDLHNRVNAFNGKYIFPFNKFMEKIARVAKSMQMISGGDIFNSNNEVNLPIEQ